MRKYKRNLDLKNLSQHKSLFLFGPRSTGKSTLLQDQFKQANYYDLLDQDVYQRLIRNSKIIAEENTDNKNIIIIDEIQKMPQLLDEVHRLIQRAEKKFILTGSSARKLKRGAANLLAGRSWQVNMHPLNSQEIEDFELVKYLNFGGLPSVYTSLKPELELKSYVQLYLQQEIMAEALTRNLASFSQFLDLACLSVTEEINYESFARDSGISVSTIKNYFQILEDTLVGKLLPAYTKTKKRKAISRAKFYFFDVGVANYIAHRKNIEPKTELFGKSFEQFIFQEILCAKDYLNKDSEIKYWRSTSQFEVDFIIDNFKFEKNVAIEVKATEQVHAGHLNGLLALKEEKLIKNLIIVSLDKKTRVLENGIVVLPWKIFLAHLWSGKYFE